MIFRLGYVAMTLNLHDASPSGTVTLTAFNRLPDREAGLYRLRRVAKKNLDNTLRILRYNEAVGIKVYRLTSKLIPLATHPVSDGWDYASEFSSEFKAIGDFIREKDFRVSAHPDHFTLLNSKKGKVYEDSLKDLEYHVRVFEAMGLSDYRYKLVLHVGGHYGSKQESIERFRENFSMLPERIGKRIILENDDKSYTATEVLGLSKELGIPMVLDVHHHKCLNGGEKVSDLLPEIFDTWKGEYFVPKVHFSSPRSDSDFRSHADDINQDEFISFLESAKPAGRNFDVMLEAKRKDSALFALSERLKSEKALRALSESEFEYK